MSYRDNDIDWQAKHSKLKKRLETALQELEDARFALARPPEWGNCRRGCSPAYLDRDGFCSPACHLGAPKGRHVTSTDAQPTQGASA